VYRLLFWLVLRWLPAETAHHLGIAALRALAASGLARLLARLWAPRASELEVHAFGRRLPSPIGLAAGLDKDAQAPDALAALGFGFVEVGTVTASAQPGNPRPRLFRLPRDRALVNRMGFNNQGAAAAAARLARRRGATACVGGNIGKSKATPDEAAIDDYRQSARALAPVCDYLVVNVSSPNTPGLRDLQATARLEPILTAVRGELDAAAPGRRVPLLVKIAPDLADDDIDAVADLALRLGLDGIVATNTTIGRGGLSTPADRVAALGAGGLSGPPLADRALAVLRRLRARVGDRLLLVAAGGVTTADDVYQRLAAGAGLVQIYTAFIYGGPGTPRRLARDLARRLRAEGTTVESLTRREA
jgi:dihydroorotate dehydrogenase